MSFPGAAGVGDRTLSSLLRGIRVGIFGTLAVLQKKETPRKPWIVYILTVVQFFQMLHFVRSAQRFWRRRNASSSFVASPCFPEFN